MDNKRKNMSEIIIEELKKLQDSENALFQQKLTPGVDADRFLGVRVPDCRKLAKTLMKEFTDDSKAFFKELPHYYFDENMLHGLMIAEIKDYDGCIKELELFLPYIDNWAVCDSISPVSFKRNRIKLIDKCQEWISSEHTYTCRFGMLMLMKHFLDEDFKEDYLRLPADVVSDEYYVNMMRAWYYATALAKQWDETIPFIENVILDPWTHNKTIQKACESFRISSEQKKYLQGLKV